MNPALRQLFKRGNRTAWVTLVISLGLVLLLDYAIVLQATQMAEQHFQKASQDVLDDIDDRLRGHELILLGGAGLWDASAAVSRSAWHDYVARLQLERHSIGSMLGVGYSQFVRPDELVAHVKAVQADNLPHYSVRPAGERPHYVPVVYLEPYSERAQSVIGFDLGSDPTRARVLRQAAESGNAAISGKLNLTGGAKSKSEVGFLMVVPVYRKHQPLATASERWQAVQGFVYSAYRVKELMAKRGGESSLPVTFRIFDGENPSAETLMYDSAVPGGLVTEGFASTHWKQSQLKPMYGHNWTFQFQSKPEAEVSWLSPEHLIFPFMGASLSGLLFLFVSVLNSRRERAEMMAAQMTAELRIQTQQVQKSQQMLNLIVENTPVGVFLKDAKTFRYELVNRAWSEMHERDGQSMVGKTVYEVFNPVLAAKFDLSDRDAIDLDRVQIDEENRLRTPLGHDRVLRTMKVGVRDASGQMTHLLGVSVNITEQVTARAAMKESAELMQVVFDNVADGIITLDGQGRVESMNRSAELMFGYGVAEVQGRSIKMLAPQTYHAQVNAFLEKNHQGFVSGRIGMHSQVEGLCKNGHIFPMELAISGSTHQGQPLLIGLVRDISERQKNEQMKASFVATVSHELRTPLTSINGALGLVCGGVLGEVSQQAKSMLDMAYKNSQRLTLLINDLLDLEKLAAGKMRLNMSIEALAPLVEQAVAMADVYAQRRQVRLRLQAPSEPVRVCVDVNRLQQVLSNLLSNAVKYSKPGDQVDVRVVLGLDQGVVRVEVTDHGPGIPVEFRGQIFQKFSQADTSDTREKGGSGLGLAISKELMERMNGLIGYESVPGQGASFHFVLPVWVESGSSVAAAPLERPSEARILVVEDHPAAASELLAILQRAGYDADVATTGAMALERVAKHPYVAITLDMVLPDQTGVALVRALRARSELDAVPIVVISTATAMGKLALQDEFLGMEWLSKPVDEAQLRGILKRRLAATRQASHREESYEA